MRTVIALASIAVHAEEMLGPDGHEHDAEAIRGLLALPYVSAYLARLRELALVPEKR